ncbi:MAG: hypothetical protein JJV97_02430 [SAR324 cluster bacterium]|nr:hypothetical protein [SAR324 cluster bacterium]
MRKDVCAAIDIGTNAVRFSVADVYQEKSGKKKVSRQVFLRVPIRLGAYKGEGKSEISDYLVGQLIKSLKSFRLLMDIFQVTSYEVVATSALREASNRFLILTRVFHETEFRIKLLSDQQEAKITAQAVASKLNLSSNYLLHIDIGGGSTELTLLDGDNILLAQSFQIGTVRLLQNQVGAAQWEKLRDFIHQIVLHKNKSMVISGSGGAIDTIFCLVKKFAQHKKTNQLETDDLSSLKHLVAKQEKGTLAYNLDLSEDRADVVLPAIDILGFCLNELPVKTLLVVDIGLADGLMDFGENKHFG